MPAWLRDAGFEQIQTTEKIVPIGPWPKEKKLKEIGRYYQMHLLDGGRTIGTMREGIMLTDGRDGELYHGSLHS